jgi:autotransporter-associated beta strand protein
VGFSSSATAANGVFINNGATAGGAGGAYTNFDNTSTAANGTFTNNGGTTSDAGGGGTFFFASSTAANGTFTNNGGTASGAGGGFTLFLNGATAENGIFTNNGGAVTGAGGGKTQFFDTSTAGSGTFVNNGPTIGGTESGFTEFFNNSTAGSATLISNGTVGGDRGGVIFFFDNSTGGTSRVEVFDNGSLDISYHNAPSVTIGSIEGTGSVNLGGNNLIVGSNNASTSFSGAIQDGGDGGGTGGSLTKIGSGTLILSGANTYTGDSNVNRGVLQVDGSINSNTSVHGNGTLAGTGTINGNVTNNGKVSPGEASGVLGVLTVVHNYTQTEYATLMIQIANAGQFSVLNVLGNANLNGFLDPVLLNGFVPTIGQTFTFLDYASLTGEFSHIQHRVFDNGLLQWSVIYEDNHAILTVEQHVPDQGSTFVLLTLGLLGLVTYRRQLLRGRS